jgi:murein DD-endopeptidase MepM/ murein hydrolase activator NlpD
MALSARRIFAAALGLMLATGAGGALAFPQPYVPSQPPAPAPAAAAPAAVTASAPPEEFADPPGDLHGSTAKGYGDPHIYAPGMRFPIEAPNVYANSQVYGHGGAFGPGGGQCDVANYQYEWHDNFCESRGYATPLCPAGHGHQGQDIRPSTCKKAHDVAVAAAAGRITQIATYTVYLTAEDGRIYRYLHLQMDQLKVHLGQQVVRGQPIGLVSNNFGKTATTIHLHFEIKAPVTQKGTTMVTFVPPYSSLVDSYRRLLAGAP